MLYGRTDKPAEFKIDVPAGGGFMVLSKEERELFEAGEAIEVYHESQNGEDVPFASITKLES